MNLIINKITGYWVTKGIITEEDKDIYVYGLDLVLFSVLNLLIITLTAVITGRLFESTLLIAVAVPLQVCGGGYHAKTHLNCFLITYIGWWCAVLLAPNINSITAIGLAIFSVIVVFILAPVANENVPISDRQSSKMKILVRIFAIFFAVTSIILTDIFFNRQIISGLIAVGLAAVAISMLASKLQYHIQKPFTANKTPSTTK